MMILDWKSKYPIHILDLKKEKYIGNYGKKGRGPGEVIQPWGFTNIDKNRFIVNDVAQKKIIGYDIDSLIKRNNYNFEKKIDKKSFISFIEFYKKSLFYLDETNFNHRVFKKDFNNDSSSSVGYGIIPTLIDESESDNVKAHASSVLMKSNNGNFVFAYKFSPRIDIFNYNKNTWKSIVSPKNFKVQYRSDFEEGMSFFAVTNKTLNSYLDIALTEKYIYTLFSEDKSLDNVISKGHDIYVYDYQGKPIKKFKLDKDISFFNVKNDSIIYAINYDITPKLLKFNIK